MREIKAEEITAAVAQSLREINFKMDPDLKQHLEKAKETEASPLGRQALELLLENAQMASAGVHPLCQDTGLAVIFVELGQEVQVIGDLNLAIQAGVREATAAGRLRTSVTVHPVSRGNTMDNTPAIIHHEIVPGKGLRLRIMAKGGGCENASDLVMLTPSASRHGVSEFVLQTVREKGATACPPLIIGVGVGGNFETAPLLAKKALLRKIGEPSPDPILARLEEVILTHLNESGLGPQGWGGSTTALAVAIEAAPCHIASLPVAVNLECHSHRVAEVKI
jgi:fumarate hydratase subunit alpha